VLPGGIEYGIVVTVVSLLIIFHKRIVQSIRVMSISNRNKTANFFYFVCTFMVEIQKLSELWQQWSSL
jgi:hypothetical protein